MATFVFRLLAPRPNFALDMSDEERTVMERHAAHWQPLIEFGSVNASPTGADAFYSPPCSML